MTRPLFCRFACYFIVALLLHDRYNVTCWFVAVPMEPSLANCFDDPLVSDRQLHLALPPSQRTQSRETRKRKAERELDAPPAARRINVSTCALAAKSLFFRALLCNGMKESKEHKVIIPVANEREQQMLVQLIQFIYDACLFDECKLEELLEMRVCADKYEGSP